jgi:hypothetical protein
MDRCPVELIDIIVTELEYLVQWSLDDNWDYQQNCVVEPTEALPKLSHYSSITRAFQYAIERRTFRSIRIELSELSFLDSMLVDNHFRSSCIRSLGINIKIGSTNRTQRLESVLQWECHDRVFTNAIQSIVTIINGWTTAKPELTFSVTSSVPDFRWMRNTLSLLDPIPSFSNISAIQIDGWRSIKSQSIIDIVSKSPELRSFKSFFYDREHSFLHLQRANRYHLAKSLRNLPIDFLETVDLSWKSGSVCLGSILVKNSDHLTISLHWLSLAPNLQSLSINGCAVSPCLFWPDNVVEAEPRWPNLKSYFVNATNSTPDGSFFAIPSDGSDRYIPPSLHVPGFGLMGELDSNLDWKTILNKWNKDETLLSQGLEFLKNPLIASSYADDTHLHLLDSKLFESYIFSMVKAKSNMPKIEHFCFQITHGRPPFNVVYDKSKASFTINNTSKDPWIPSVKLMGAIKLSLRDHETVQLRVTDPL